VSPKERRMITPENYVKKLLKRRNITQADLLRKMKQLNLGDENLHKEHLNEAINKRMSFVWGRRIEIALNLPNYSLIKMIGEPTENQWKKIKEVGRNV